MTVDKPGPNAETRFGSFGRWEAGSFRRAEAGPTRENWGTWTCRDKRLSNLARVLTWWDRWRCRLGDSARVGWANRIGGGVLRRLGPRGQKRIDRIFKGQR